MKRWVVVLSAVFFSSLTFASVPPGAQVTLQNGDPSVGTYVSSPRGFSTSSYWIEGPDGLLWIDTQFLLSAGKEALDWAEKTTGKKVKLAIVLHPNPDKFNGVKTFQDRGIPVVTSEQVLALIPEVHTLRSGWFFERYKPDYPTEAPKPDSFGNATKKLTAGGVEVTAHVLGKGASGAHVVVTYKEHMFPGDLVTNGNHSWLELGYLDEWLQRIGELKKMNVAYVHPGRGPSGGAELIDREEAYLKKVRQLVLAEKPRGEATDAQLEKVQAKIEAAYPGYGFTHFLELGLPDTWERLAMKKKK